MRHTLGNINKFNFYYLAYNFADLEMFEGNTEKALCN